MTGSTAERIVREARDLIMTRGYNGFSYADIAEAVGIRKASIHHHFPAKSDLAKAVIEETRAVIRAQTELLAAAEPDAGDQLRGYAGYWSAAFWTIARPFAWRGCWPPNCRACRTILSRRCVLISRTLAAG